VIVVDHKGSNQFAVPIAAAIAVPISIELQSAIAIHIDSTAAAVTPTHSQSHCRRRLNVFGLFVVKKVTGSTTKSAA